MPYSYLRIYVDESSNTVDRLGDGPRLGFLGKGACEAFNELGQQNWELKGFCKATSFTEVVLEGHQNIDCVSVYTFIQDTTPLVQETLEELQKIQTELGQK